jgi:hypothetical protein
MVDPFRFDTEPESMSNLLPEDEHGKRLEAGKPCPFCGKGIADYDGVLNLRCPVCGAQESGGFT